MGNNFYRPPMDSIPEVGAYGQAVGRTNTNFRPERLSHHQLKHMPRHLHSYNGSL